MQDSTDMITKVQKFETSSEMHIKAQSLETRVDKMMQEMDNVQKLMHMPFEPSDDDDLYEDPSGDFDIDGITTSVAIQQQVGFEFFISEGRKKNGSGAILYISNMNY